MANVMFKRGQHQNLPNNGSALDGVFYLTTDTQRLYVGDENHNLVELNKSIHIINDLDTLYNLPNSQIAVGQFYYIIGSGSEHPAENTHNGNILAVCVDIDDSTGKPTWVQVNPDTNTNTDTGYDYIDNMTVSDGSVVDGTNGQKRIKYTITLDPKHTGVNGGNDITGKTKITADFYVNGSDIGSVVSDVAVKMTSTAVSNGSTTINVDGAGSDKTGGFTLKAGDNVQLSGGGTTAITIASTGYELQSTTGSTAVSLKSTEDDTDTVNFTAGTALKVDGSKAGEIQYSHNTVNHTTTATTATASEGAKIPVIGSVTVNTEGHVTNIETKTITAKDTTYTAKSINADNNGNLSFVIEDNNQQTSSKTTTGVLFHTITVDGSATATVYNQGHLGSFYSASKIDEKIAGLNAMTYKGTVGSTNGEVKSLPIAGNNDLRVGDTYLVVDDGTYGGQSSKTGDLLIASGTEGTNGVITSNLTWTVVPAGERDTTYTTRVNNNTIYYKPSTSDDENTLVTIAGGTAITASTNGSTITLNHNNVFGSTTSVGNNTAKTLSYGEGFKVPVVKVDAQGHITELKDIELKIPKTDHVGYGLTTTSVNSKPTIILTGTDDSTSSASIAGDGVSISTTAAATGVTITHKDLLSNGTPNTSYGSSSAVLSSKGQFIIPQIKVNKQGHITDISSQTITLPNSDYVFNPPNVSTTTNVTTIQTALHKDGESDTTTSTFSITSSSLTLSSTNTQVNVDIEWGSF